MTAPQDRQPATEAGRRLLEHVSNLNSRAFPLMTGEDLRAVEREARAETLAQLREGVAAIEDNRPDSYDWPCSEAWFDACAAVLALIEKASESEGAKE